jgi:actin
MVLLVLYEIAVTVIVAVGFFYLAFNNWQKLSRSSAASVQHDPNLRKRSTLSAQSAQITPREQRDESSAAARDASIVVDCGSSSIKLGFSDAPNPQYIIPTLVGRPRQREVIPGLQSKSIYFGEEVRNKRSILSISHPIERDHVRDWDELSQLVQYGFQLLGSQLAHRSIVLCDSLIRSDGDRLISLLGERFATTCVSADYPVAVLASRSNRSTGVLVNSGDSITEIIPVVNGRSIEHAIRRIRLGGSDVTDRLVSLLNKSGVRLSDSERDFVAGLKRSCFVRIDSNPVEESEVELADGRKIRWANERFECAEILFDTSLIGRERESIVQAIDAAVASCDKNEREVLLQNIVLAGGNTLLAGFAERVSIELGKITNFNVNVDASQRREWLVWSSVAAATK